MEREALQRVLQVTLLAVVGLIAALIAGYFVMRSVMVDPKTMSLAMRVPAERATIFVRTTDRAEFFRKVELLVKNGPDESGIPAGERYEFAALRELGTSGAGWVTYVWQENGQKHVTVASANDPLLFLDLKELGRSLGARSPLLRQRKGDEPAVWLKSETLPLPSSLGLVIRSAVGTDTELLLETHATGGTLRMAGPNLGRGTATVRSLAPALTATPLLLLEMGSPNQAATRIAAELTAHDPTLAEGMRGILQSLLRDYADGTDIKTAADELLAGPLSIAIQPTSFAVSGTAKRNDVPMQWLHALAGEVEGGTVRRMTFFNNENVRTDVTATAEESLRETGTYKGWKLVELGSTGSALRLFAATQASKYILTNDNALLTSVIDMPGGSVTWSGEADLNWLATQLGVRSPFLVPGSVDILRLLGPSASRLRWHSTTEPWGRSIKWTVL